MPIVRAAAESRRWPPEGTPRLEPGAAVDLARPGRLRCAKLDGVTVEIRTAAELLAAERSGEWAARRAQRDDPVLRAIWREFVERGGPVALEAVAAGVPGLAPDGVRDRAAALDEADLIGLTGDRVGLAYPFTASPNAYQVTLPGGRARYACCAIDALGVAPMLGTPVTVRSRCHRSAAPLVFDVDPVGGPRDAPPGVLTWIERGQSGGDRRSGFL
jgi:Alkylmercury lyase